MDNKMPDCPLVEKLKDALVALMKHRAKRDEYDLKTFYAIGTPLCDTESTCYVHVIQTYGKSKARAIRNRLVTQIEHDLEVTDRLVRIMT